MQSSNFQFSNNSNQGMLPRTISNAALLHNDLHLNNDDRLVRFPTEQRVSKKKWTCNISKHLKFSEKHEHYLQIDPLNNCNQFQILCGLLRANTCHVIYFDENFNEQELSEIRQLQSLTKTELINSKVAFCLSKSSRQRESA